MASTKELLGTIKPSMKLDKAFFMKVYGYEISFPGFAEMALSRLEILGCSRARAYYMCAVAEYEYHRDKELKEVAKWYSKKIEEGYKKGGDNRWRENLQRMSNADLLVYLESLSAEGLPQ